jgi:imidazolonepropionase-like amidohydrolase
MGRIADGVPAVQHAVRDEIRLGADQIKVMASGGVASAADPIHFLQYSDAELVAIVDEARRANTYVMAHAYTSPAIARAVKAGVRTVEHGNFLDQETAKLMANQDVFLVPTLATYYMTTKYGEKFGFPAESLVKLQKVMSVGSQVLRIAKDAGVKMGFGTDLLGELHEYQSEEFTIRNEVLSPIEILQSATLVGAEILNMHGQLGVIAQGALADIIVVERNPLDDLNVLKEQGKHMPLIMKDGQLVKNLLS